MRAKNSGLQGSITKFFEDNPEEFLTMRDAMVKWEASRKQITDALAHLKAAGSLVVMDRDEIASYWPHY